MKLRWTSRDIAEFLEYKNSHNLLTEDEFDIYLDYKMTGKIKRDKYPNTYKSIIRQLRREYEGW